MKSLKSLPAALALLFCLLSAPSGFAQTTPKSPLVDIAAPGTAMKMGELIAELKKGGTILLIRHERTEVPSVEDDYSKAMDDCRSQRNLSAAGYAGAAETRASLRALGIRVEQVLSSPMCRNTETARQMFVTYTVEPRLMHEMVDQGRTNDVAAADLKAVLDGIGVRSGNVALVTHAGLIQRATGIYVAEGGIVVLRVEAGGKFALLKQVMGSDFGPHAREALGPVKP